MTPPRDDHLTAQDLTVATALERLTAQDLTVATALERIRTTVEFEGRATRETLAHMSERMDALDGRCTQRRTACRGEVDERLDTLDEHIEDLRPQAALVPALAAGPPPAIPPVVATLAARSAGLVAVALVAGVVLGHLGPTAWPWLQWALQLALRITTGGA